MQKMSPFFLTVSSLFKVFIPDTQHKMTLGRFNCQILVDKVQQRVH